MRRSRIFAFVLAATVIAPGTAYATSAVRPFNPASLDLGLFKRIGSDWSMPASSNTGVFGDIDACISGTHYVHGKLVRNRTGLPDVTQLPLDYLYYCPLDKYWRGSWPNASYHFDAANGTSGNTSSGASFEAWW